LRGNPYPHIHTSITFGLGQAKSKTRSHTHLHNCLSHPPPTRFPTSSTNITHLAPQPIPKPCLKSRLAWPQRGQGHPTTFSSLVSFLPQARVMHHVHTAHMHLSPLTRVIKLSSSHLIPLHHPSFISSFPSLLLTRVTFAAPLTQRDTTNKITPTHVTSFYQLKPTYTYPCLPRIPLPLSP
ncbi:hypothetical protein PIB30_107717, partial [Stylosanthes scabra]|nr:hypothetical protein [Stylosanthes scabra]